MNPLLNSNNLKKLHFYISPPAGFSYAKDLNHRQALTLLLKLNQQSVQDLFVNTHELAEFLVKDIGFANLPSLRELRINEAYQ